MPAAKTSTKAPAKRRTKASASAKPKASKAKAASKTPIRKRATKKSVSGQSIGDPKKYLAKEYNKMARSLPQWAKGILAAIVLIASLSFYFYSEGFDIYPNKDASEYLCTKVVDGDTIHLKSSDSDNVLKIRLYGIDAPERSQKFGSQSTQAMKEYVLNKKVKLDKVNEDRYGRIVGKIYSDGVYVNLDMIKNGYAWHYDHYSQDSDLKKAQQNAKDKKLGLWSDKSTPQEPWRYRKSQN